MDLTSVFLMCLMSCIIGAVLMLLVQYYAIVKYFDVPEASEEQRSINEQYMLPDVSIIHSFLLYVYWFSSNRMRVGI